MNTMTQFEIPNPANRTVTVLGAGVLGRRIACTWAAAGYEVSIRDPSEAQRNAAVQYIEQNIRSEDYARLTADGRGSGKYKVFEELAPAVRNAFLVIEAVPEKLELKIDTMAELEKSAPSDCIIGSNSSSYKSRLMLDKVSQQMRCRILNVHYQMPPTIRAVELMTDGETQPEIFPFLTKLHEDIGLLPAVARKESTGFIMNRLWAAIKRETMMIMAEGVSEAGEIDKLFKHMFQSSIGPCAMMDQVGLDTVAFIEDNYIQERHLDSSLTVDWLRKNYIDQGKLGAKSGKGGLFPPGETVQHSDDTAKHHTVDSTTAPLLYVLDIGIGSNVSSMQEATHSGRVIAISADAKTSRELITGLPMPDGIQVSIPTNRIFFTNMGRSGNGNDGSLMSAGLDGKDVRTIVKEGDVHTPKQLTLDEDAQKIYFCDREGMRIHRCNYDGTEHEVLVQTGKWRNEAENKDQTRWCVGITVDPQHGHIYWTQKGASKGGQGRIFRAGIEIPENESPTERSDIECLFRDLPEPIDLEIVPETQTLYWTDRGEYPLGNTLNKADVGTVDGKQGGALQRQVLARHFHEAIGLKLDQINHHIYVSDLGGSVYRFDMDGQNKKEIWRSDGAFTGLDLAFVGH